MIFDSGSNFDSLHDDSGSRFIYIWLSVDDSRSRISSSFFFLYNLRSKFNRWLVTQGQGLILMERWFAHLWGLNDWFWRLFLMCLWSFVHGEVCSWIFLLRWFVEILIVKNFLFLGIFFLIFLFLKFCSLRFFHCEDLFNAHLEA